MNTFKLLIESDLAKVGLKDYNVKFIDVQATTHQEAIKQVQTEYGNNFKVALSSIMPNKE